MGGADDAAPPGSDELAEVTFSDSTANFKGQFHGTQSFFSMYFLNNLDFFAITYF